MIPFVSVTAVFDWFRSVERPVSVLIDFTSIGVGLQKRTITANRSVWVLGFPVITLVIRPTGVPLKMFGGSR